MKNYAVSAVRTGRSLVNSMGDIILNRLIEASGHCSPSVKTFCRRREAVPVIIRKSIMREAKNSSCGVITNDKSQLKSDYMFVCVER